MCNAIFLLFARTWFLVVCYASSSADHRAKQRTGCDFSRKNVGSLRYLCLGFFELRVDISGDAARFPNFSCVLFDSQVSVCLIVSADSTEGATFAIRGVSRAMYITLYTILEITATIA